MAAILLGATACREPEGPRETYAHYLQALAEGQLREAYLLLSIASRDRLADAEAAWRDSGNEPSGLTTPEWNDSPSGFALFRMRMSGPDGQRHPPFPEDAASLIESIRVEGTRALVSIRTPLGLREAVLVREQGAWGVDLKID